MWPVFVLLWMHMLVRKRRFLITIVDYFMPIVMFVLMYFVIKALVGGMKEDTKPPEKKEPEQDQDQQLSYDEMLRKHGRGSILYTPETPFTNRLMDEVGAKLNLVRLDHLPVNGETGYFPFSNKIALSILEYSKNMTSDDAILIFENVESKSAPKTLSYTIRMKNNNKEKEFELTNIESYLEIFGIEQRRDFLTPYEPFMRLQWAIDSSFLRLLTGDNVDQSFALQELPYASPKTNTKFVLVLGTAVVLLPFAIYYSYLLLAYKLFDGKNSGIHELIKMVGVSWETLAISHVIDVVPIMLIYSVGGTLFFKLLDLTPFTGGGFIFVALFLHFWSVIALAFFVVYLFNIVEYTRLIPVIVYLSFYIVSLVVTFKILDNRPVAILLCVLLPHNPLHRFLMAVAVRETSGFSVTTSNMWHDQFTSETMKIPEHYLAAFVQTLILAVLATYLARVRPGKYGQALPWNFPFNRAYWRHKPVGDSAPEETPVASETDQQYFEKAPAGLPIGIDVANVYKSFGKDQVLHGVTLAVFRGEITVLLGHNGAGKTTLISIITGVISTTSGRVLVEGYDTLTQSKKARRLIGYCPQQNIFIPELTVLQHTRFYAMLKGMSYSQSRSAALELFSRLQLSDKAGASTSQLSGGMLRRTQLACAIVGGSRVLLLDEPTSGLDVETRRELWDLLLGLRGDRTVLLTTHFMEEADALGDRIAALHQGRVKCHATSMFLKRAIGTGYRLSLTTIGPPDEAAITSTITAIVPEAAVADRRPTGLSYSLPAQESARFPALFAALEERRAELRIETIGVGKSTLDEVFVKLCSDEKITYSEDIDAHAVEAERENVKGAKLCARQFAVLLLRQLRFMWSKMFFIIFVTIFFIVLIWGFTEMSNNVQADSKSDDKVALNLDLYKARAHRALVNLDKEDTLQALRAGFKNTYFVEVPVINAAVLRTTQPIFEDFIVGIVLNNSTAKALYSPKLRHAAPVALNALSNALAARAGAAAHTPRVLSARSHPLRGAYLPYKENKLKRIKDTEKIQSWARMITFITHIFLSSMLALPCDELTTGMRNALVRAGAPRALVWGATFAMHFSRSFLTCVVPAIIIAAVVDDDATLNQNGFLFAAFIVLMLGSLASAWFMYFICVLNPDRANLIIMIIIFISCFIFTYLTGIISDIFAALVTPYTMNMGLVRGGRVARLNAFCHNNRDKCPVLDLSDDGFEAKKCCDSSPGSDPWSYWAWGALAPTVLFLGIHTVVFIVLTLMLDSGSLAFLSTMFGRVAEPRLRFDDPAARAEADYVARTIQMSKNAIPDVILVNKIQKLFKNCKCVPFFAVKRLSFSVKRGECFGLLGVNGAGKSTTFGMLTAQTQPTAGKIYANGHYSSDGVKYMQTFSYCPQFGGVDDFLTGRQNLETMLTIRGLHHADVTAVAAYWLQEVELTRAADKRVSSYSGGMARRLAAAAALCQAARTTVLDEPTAGVDPVARRRMHVALMRAKRNRSIIVASHSLDEIEALCHRIGIMSGGELRALGSAAALKAQYGQGYSVVFKLVVSQDVDGAAMLEEFKRQLYSRFNCELRDEHLGTLSYHFNDSLRYSELFTQLEQLKAQFPALVEDYTVTETTLEEVFLALAKEAHQQPASPNAPGAPAPPSKAVA